MTVVQDVRSAAHSCAFPDSDEERAEIRAGFVADGLTAGEQVIYFDDGTVDEVLERLADDQVPVQHPIRTGQLAVLPPEQTRATLRLPAPQLLAVLDEAIDGAVEAGYPGVRLTGDSVEAHRNGGTAALVAYETLLDDLLADRPAKLLCFYDSRFPDEAMHEMRGAHRCEVRAPALYDDGLLRITRSGAGAARIAGEVDHSNRPRLRKLLDQALDEALRSHSSPTDITLDLASLRFLDVAGAVSLVHAAEEFPSTHRLVLTRVRPPVLRLLDRCGAPFATQLGVHARVEPDARTPTGFPADRAAAS